MINAIGATVLKEPSLNLTEEEAKNLSDAYINLAQHYEIPVLSPKHLALANFAGVVGMVYGTRLIALSKKMRNKKPHLVQHPQPIQTTGFVQNV